MSEINPLLIFLACFQLLSCVLSFYERKYKFAIGTLALVITTVLCMLTENKNFLLVLIGLSAVLYVIHSVDSYKEKKRKES